MNLIVGLGNPGKKYARTRHNVGFLAIDELARRLSLSFSEKTSLEAEIAEGADFFLLKPHTYMNVSGRSVKALLSRQKLGPDQILIVYDDADIPFGDVRLKLSGSSGGHNGMKSILDLFEKGTAVARVRIGIGRPSHPDIPLDAFVLQPFTKEEETLLPQIIDKTIELIFTHFPSET